MAAPSDILGYECLDGPFDGRRIRSSAHRLVVRQFENSRYVHVYDLVDEDDGTRVWTYRGTREAPRATQAA